VSLAPAAISTASPLTTVPQSNQSSGHPVSSMGAIIGGAIGGVVVVIVALAALLFALRSRKSRQIFIRRRSILAQDMERQTAGSKPLPVGLYHSRPDPLTWSQSFPATDDSAAASPISAGPHSLLENPFPPGSERASTSRHATSDSADSGHFTKERLAELYRDAVPGATKSPTILRTEISDVFSIEAQRLMEHVYLEAERNVAQIHRAQLNPGLVQHSDRPGLLTESPPPSYRFTKIN